MFEDISKQFDADPSEIPFGEVEEETVENPSEHPEKKDEEDSEDEQPRRKTHDERRWERLMRERNEDRETISQLKKFKEEVEQGSYSMADEEVPEYFKKMYEDGIPLEERWKMVRNYEQQREQRLIEQAQEKVLSQIQTKQAEEEKWESYIDEQLELLEEKYNVDFLSERPGASRRRRDFLKTLQKISPKDEYGDILQYASFEDTFELWNKTANKGSEKEAIARKKDIASMGNRNRPVTNQEIESGDGGMWGWMRDLKR